MEVDIVSLDQRTQKPRFAVEVKWSDRIVSAPSTLRALCDLASKFTLARTPLVTTRSHTGAMEYNGTEIEFMPVALHCYTIARNLLRDSR